ncbi:MAG: NADH:ubiquinone oxidoreductase [Sedimenticola sp.]
MASLFWLQTGACGGDSLAILSAASPSLEQLFDYHDVELLWHPSFSHASRRQYDDLLQRILSGEQPLDILCIEGSIVTAPNGTGLNDSYQGKAKMVMVQELAARAGCLVAVGTCAAYGGVHAAPPNPSDCVGLQFDQASPGGLFEADWRSARGMPVINLAGCPAHPHTMTQTIAALAAGEVLELDHLQRPKTFFSTIVHQGCTRNEYHEYDIEETEVGGKACMFFNMGCQGPMTAAICNSDLWNGRSSKTRAGVPCFGCTSPDFPKTQSLFDTEKVGEVPVILPAGVDRAKFMAYKGLAHAAAPERVKKREMEP